MHSTAASLLAMLGLLATACQAIPPHRAQSGARQAPGSTDNGGLNEVPECAEGGSATLAEGLRIGYLGSDPDDPQRCLLRWADRSHSLYFGFWSANGQVPMSEEARSAIRAALTGPVGTETSFETQRAQLWRRVTLNHVANNMVDVDGKPRPALELRVVLHDAHGRPDVRAETRYTIDRTTGVLLRRQSITPMANGEVTTTTSWQIGRLDEAG